MTSTRKPELGMVVGAVLGFIDGLSARFSPDARSMMMAIVIGSTVKGIITGLLGWIHRQNVECDDDRRGERSGAVLKFFRYVQAEQPHLSPKTKGGADPYQALKSGLDGHFTD